MTQNQRYIADVGWRMLFRTLTRGLPGWSHKSGIRCNRRINDHLGIRMRFDKWVNKTIDPLLGPFIGKNSASRACSWFKYYSNAVEF